MSAFVVFNQRVLSVSSVKSIYYWLEFALTWVFLWVIRLFPFATRIRLGGAVLGFIISNLPNSKARIDRNLRNVFPNMSSKRRRKITKKVGKTFGKSIIETLNGKDYVKQQHLFHASGPGLEVLHDAINAGKGFILISSHFGQSDAVRHYLKGQGIEVGAVYRPHNNPFFNRLFQREISYSGTPTFPKGRRGTMNLVKHLRQGGYVSILLDQKYSKGKNIKFLGHKTFTSIAPAQMALRYDIPMIPVYGTRRADSDDIDIEFEAPIPHSSPKRMTRLANKSLSKRVRKNPGQWYWLHQRWNFED